MILRIFRLSLVLFLVTALPAPHAFAEDTKIDEAALEKAAKEAQAQKEDAALSVRERVDAFTADLSSEEQAHFMAIYGSHNLIGVVKIVQESVADAVKKCVENNPDQAEALKTRHKEWKTAIDPILKDAEANVKNMTIAQDYAKKRDIKKILKRADKTRKEQDKNVEKIPVTTPEACEFLRNKMDETEDNLIHLLESTLISLPQALERADEEDIPEEDTPKEDTKDL